MTSHTIRKLVKEDTANFFKLRLNGLQEAPTSFSSSYIEERTAGSSFFESVLARTDNDNVIYGAFMESQLIGVVGIYCEASPKTKHKSNIWGLYVHPNYRYLGIGKNLMHAAIIHARTHMYTKTINLSVEANNLRARRLYESLGFFAWGREPKALKLNERFYDELHMSIILP